MDRVDLFEHWWIVWSKGHTPTVTLAWLSDVEALNLIENGQRVERFSS